MDETKITSNEKMTWGGIGPRLACITLPYVILALAVMHKDPGFLRLDFLDILPVEVFGYVLLGIGLVFWGASAVVFLKEFKQGKLIVRGPFALCRNPIYASIIVFIVPSFVLIFHSGMILTIDLVLYQNFTLSIHGERLVLRRTFGDAYASYERSVNELFPFPRV